MIDKDKVQYLIDSILEQVVSIQMSESNCSIEDALCVIYYCCPIKSGFD